MPSLLGCVGITSPQRKDFYLCLHASVGKTSKKINAPKPESLIFNPQCRTREGGRSVLNTALGEDGAQPPRAPLTTRTDAGTAAPGDTNRPHRRRPREGPHGRGRPLQPRRFRRRPERGASPPARRQPPPHSSPRSAAPGNGSAASGRPRADMSEFGAGAELPGWVTESRSRGGKGGKYRAERCGRGRERGAGAASGGGGGRGA